MFKIFLYIIALVCVQIYIIIFSIDIVFIIIPFTIFFIIFHVPSWRNWISRLTSNQKSVGSSPTGGNKNYLLVIVF